MSIGGLQKLTLLDFPGHVACTVFFQGCNFRCPFCHNTPLLAGGGGIAEEEILSFLKKRQGLLDGVAITGGEPLLQPDIEDFLKQVKELGFSVKLDTNGSFPKKLASLIRQGLVDYVAMDVKSSKKHYPRVAGTDRFLPEVEESVSILLDGKIPYEFRTTVVKELHCDEDFHEIGQWLQGADQYFLQNFVDSGHILSPGLHAPERQELERYLSIAKQYIPNTQLRGLE